MGLGTRNPFRTLHPNHRTLKHGGDGIMLWDHYKTKDQFKKLNLETFFRF